jgi:hypothetical protein
MNLLNTASRGARLARTLHNAYFAAACLCALAAALSVTTSQAKDLPPEGPIPVEVQGPVEVVGAVDVLSVPKKVRYIQRRSVSIEPGPVSNFVHFTIPAGKMLVVETVSAEGYLGTSVGFTYGFLEQLATSPEAPAGTLSLPMSSQGGGAFMSTQSVLLRVDSSQNLLSARFYRSPNSADSGAFYLITVFGYLEDL